MSDHKRRFRPRPQRSGFRPRNNGGQNSNGHFQSNGNGGIKVWLGSHKEGVTASSKSDNGLRITKNIKYIKKKYPSENFYFDKGDFAIFNSLLQHEGLLNHSKRTRIVQLIRYSNLLNQKSYI